MIYDFIGSTNILYFVSRPIKISNCYHHIISIFYFSFLISLYIFLAYLKSTVDRCTKPYLKIQ